MTADKKNYFKILLVFILCLLARLIPFRMPNIEPILAATMPIGRAHGAFISFSFAVFSILLYDLITSTLGVQTLFTALSYGIIALWSVSYFSAKGGSASGGKDNKWSYARFAIMGTLVYDALTGLTVGPLFFHQSFIGSLLGQIPFTAFHLIGNTIFALILSPAIYNFMIKKKKKESVSIINIPNPKTI
ncbi:hypothetical protein A2121_00120 [Candidatus Nomurabacteria bacterium GWB1_40_6]|uniref:ECF transporter S component n=1 Tax=Candidatus Nomurabacteria bacterium GWB1_40_6 TaxID=1801727 RepID=A0A1F6TNY5_9BACT|nr:MAG: hypothetical protein A2121_00120 [Candidatus Nomurabacteria bacterium GWB1_40_6]